MFKNCIVAAVVFVLAACASTEQKQSKPLLTYGLIYGITLDENKTVINIRLARVEDPYKKQQIEFTPTPEYSANAERQLKVRDYGDAEVNKEFFVICGYADVRPDTALCGGDL
ncbi:hypothetical protein [Bowmanella yangjiangensis]|uniref:Lipoprotein n=1 Tax=Bowmanella yangjiangensis TaxID=2811230 RepID=A0ABS3CRY4_9ALTE|nr:hypothetical protein [Bowmanella yangjiangensis]MBN7819874.1 hypothetical protein [Bowmanella yangjiangensis]